MEVDIKTAIQNALTKAEGDGLTLYAVAKAAGLKPELLYRFVAGERDLRLSSAAKLCSVLRLELRPIAPARPTSAKRKTKKT